MAPNLITLIGTAWMASAAMIWAYQDGTLTETVPVWTYHYAAFSVFMIQTFDACDGKQARRTGTASPLG